MVPWKTYMCICVPTFVGLMLSRFERKKKHEKIKKVYTAFRFK